MWLFRSSTSSETDVPPVNEATHAERHRNKQIGWLREQVKNVAEVERDVRYRVEFSVEDKIIILDIILSERFPLESPKVTAFPQFTHPWVDSQMVVIGSPLLQQFTPHSNLGSVVLQIINEFTSHPPRFDSGSGVAMATQPPYPIIPPSPYVGQGPSSFLPSSYPPVGEGGLLFTPYSYSSVSTPPIQSFSSDVDTSSPPMAATPISIGSRRSSIFGCAVPDKLPGISEMSEEELKRFISDEDAVVLIDKYISKLDLIKNVQAKMESVFQENEELARTNTDLEPSFVEKSNKLLEKYAELQSLKENVERLQSKQNQLLEKHSGRKVLSQLKTLTQQSDTDSEIIAEDFLEQKIESASFVQKFLQERKLYHLRSAKMELYKYSRT